MDVFLLARSPTWLGRRAGFPLVGKLVLWRQATSKADEYRAKAQEAEQLAERTTDSVIKEQALRIAEQWRYMRRKVWRS